VPLEASDAIYINAGVARPMNIWLDALKDGGRLMLPLTTSYTSDQGHAMTRGAIFLIERQGRDFIAQWKSQTGIYPCFGARDEASEIALKEAFEKDGWEKVTRLYRTADIDRNDAGCAAQIGRLPIEAAVPLTTEFRLHEDFQVEARATSIAPRKAHGCLVGCSRIRVAERCDAED
jgi:hypothetical protein